MKKTLTPEEFKHVLLHFTKGSSFNPALHFVVFIALLVALPFFLPAWTVVPIISFFITFRTIHIFIDPVALLRLEATTSTIGYLPTLVYHFLAIFTVNHQKWLYIVEDGKIISLVGFDQAKADTPFLMVDGDTGLVTFPKDSKGILEKRPSLLWFYSTPVYLDYLQTQVEFPNRHLATYPKDDIIAIARAFEKRRRRENNISLFFILWSVFLLAVVGFFDASLFPYTYLIVIGFIALFQFVYYPIKDIRHALYMRKILK